MSTHRTRADLADANPIRVSDTDGEVLQDRSEWGSHYLVNGGAASGTRTRILPAPTHAGQRIDVSVDIGGATTVNIFTSDGATYDGTNDEIRFTADGAFTAESFLVSNSPTWHVTFNLNGTLAT